MSQYDVFRLAKPKRKGLWGLIFSRFLIIAALILFQLSLLAGFYGWLKEWIPHFTALQGLFTVLMVILLFNMPMDSTAKLTWMLVIAVMPLPGAALLWFTQTNTVHRKLRDRVEELIEQTRGAIPQKASVTEALAADGSGTDDLSRYLCRSGCFPVFENTETTYFPQGEAKFDAMLSALKSAKHYVFMEYFIIEEGFMWGEILKILIEKAKEGLEIRVMYDGMCELSKLPADYWKLLRKHGIQAKAFSAIKPVISSHYNYRDHRKILVIDGQVAFTGGVNLADEYINRVTHFGHWKDTAVMLKGDAARSFALMFLQMWNIDEKMPEFDRYLDVEPIAPEHPGGYVMPYGDCPLDGERVGEAVYMDILNRATDYVYIMTPYLILDGELEWALKYAAERGVDVKLILPGIPDKKAAYALAKSHYKGLIESGVQIYEYTPGFVHAKVFISDDIKAVVGTINLDYRSLYHHYECAAYLYKAGCIGDIKADYLETLGKCRVVTPETIRAEKLSYKLIGGMMKMIAPLM